MELKDMEQEVKVLSEVHKAMVEEYFERNQGLITNIVVANKYMYVIDEFLGKLGVSKEYEKAVKNGAEFKKE